MYCYLICKKREILLLKLFFLFLVQKNTSVFVEVVVNYTVVTNVNYRVYFLRTYRSGKVVYGQFLPNIAFPS